MSKTIALVTGGTGGIGKEVARGLAQRSMDVTIVGRAQSKGLRAAEDLRRATGNDHIDFIQADLSLMAEVRRVAEQFCARHEQLNVLVHSAGVMRLKFDRTAENIEYNIASSYLSRFLLTNLLLGLLAVGAPSRVINIAGSRGKGKVDMEHLINPRYGGMRAHGQAQAANDAFTIELAKRLDGTGTEAAALNPGAVETDIRREFPQWVLAIMKPLFGRNTKTPTEGAALPLWLATDAPYINGKLYDPARQELSVANSIREAGPALWQASARAVGLPIDS